MPFTEAAEPQWDERVGLADRMRHYAVPGVSVAVIDGFEIAWSKGYGALRTRGEDPVTPQTLFHAGSVAKCLSAAATLTLVEQGLHRGAVAGAPAILGHGRFRRRSCPAPSTTVAC